MSEDFPQIAPNGLKIYKGNPNLKSSGVSFVFTKEQIEERIRCTQDPIYFIQKYMKIVHVDRGLVPFDLYDFQKTLLKSYIDNRFTIAKLPRQVGKSTVTIAYILWTVLFGPMQNIAILANKASTSRDILAKLQLAYEHIPMWMQQGIVSWNKGSIELENGSKVIAAATASSSARGNTYNCVSGDSTVKVKIDDNEVDILFSELYELIANSSKYECHYFDNKETQYVHREQVSKTIHENSSSRFLTLTECENGNSSHNSKKSWGNRLSRKFSEFTHSISYSVSSAINQICERRIQEQCHVCVCDDGTHSKLSKTFKSRICIFKRLFERIIYWSRSFSSDERQNFEGKSRKIERYSQVSNTSSKYIQRIDWSKEDARACCKGKQKSRENSQNGRKASWYETIRGIKATNERSCKGTNTLEQREEGNLFFRSFGKNESCQERNTFNRRTQKEFEKIQVLTEAGYKDFHGIKKTINQETIKIILENNDEIICTPDHKLFSDIGYINAKDSLDKKILNHDGNFYKVNAINTNESIDVYDLLEVSDTHSYYCNNFLVHQCIFLDEFAFVPKNIAEEFITSVYPTISSGKTTKVIMVSTPNGMNLFYKYWTDATHGRNLYKPVEAHWSVVPGRDADWAEDQIKQLGQEKFDQEFGCVAGNTLITTENGCESIETVFNRAGRIYVVYKIIRDDDKIYIGTTIKDRLKNRISQHKTTERFKNHKFTLEILEESTSKSYIDAKEEYYIKHFDSYNSGLNESIDGKGNHLCNNFTTLGFKYSEKSRKKMSESAKARVARLGVPFKGKKHTPETKKNWSKKRKGRLFQYRLPESVYKELREEFEKSKQKYVEYIAANGKLLTGERQFAHEVSQKYNISVNMIVNIIKRKVLR